MWPLGRATVPHVGRCDAPNWDSGTKTRNEKHLREAITAFVCSCVTGCTFHPSRPIWRRSSEGIERRTGSWWKPLLFAQSNREADWKRHLDSPGTGGDAVLEGIWTHKTQTLQQSNIHEISLPARKQTVVVKVCRVLSLACKSNHSCISRSTFSSFVLS